MEKFRSLPVEKQNKIINAALKAFSANGYKKASASDIAGAAGISKAMVFHYFGSKKALYLYLIELCGTILMNEIEQKLDNTVSDFFERIKMLTDIEFSLMKKHPSILSFLTSFYFETDEDVKEDIKDIVAKGEDFRNKIAFDGIDMSKFKDDIDLRLVMKMLSWMADGYAAQASKNASVDYDDLMGEFNDCLNLMKNNFYKGEYV